MSQPDFPGSALRRCTRRLTCPRPTTRSWSARAARGRQRQCCWRGRGTACSWWTARRSRATPFPRMWCSRVPLPRSRAGDSSVGSRQPAVPRSIPTPSTSVRSCCPEHRGRRKARLPTVRGGPCSTNCSSMPPSKPVPTCAKASLWRSSWRTRDASSVSEVVRRAPRRSPSARRSSSGPTVGTRSWPMWSGPNSTNEKPPLLAVYYTYWSDLPMDGRFETYIRPHRGFAAAPTHDGLTLTVGGWPYAEFETNKKDIERNLRNIFDSAPEFATRMRGATRRAPFAGAAVANFFRQPYGPGWALLGDAGTTGVDFVAVPSTDWKRSRGRSTSTHSGCGPTRPASRLDRRRPASASTSRRSSGWSSRRRRPRTSRCTSTSRPRHGWSSRSKGVQFEGEIFDTGGLSHGVLRRP